MPCARTNTRGRLLHLCAWVPVCLVWVRVCAATSCMANGAATCENTNPGFEPAQACAAADLIAHAPLYGFHLLCLHALRDSPSINVIVFVDSTNHTELIEAPTSSWDSFAESINAWLGTTPQDARWAIYHTDGRQIRTMSELVGAYNSTAYLITGGNFVWPGVRVGHVQQVGISNVTLETLSLQPLVFEVHNLLTKQECEFIIEEARPHMSPSYVSKQDQDLGKEDTTWRTSETYFMDSSRRPKMREIDLRISSLTRTPKEQQEHVQVLRYKQFGKYDSHHDFFNPSLYTKDAYTLSLLEGQRNRFITVLWYLNDVPSGGETVFPREGAQPPPHSFTDCSQGLRVTPRMGKAVMFYNMLPSGQTDDYSLHGACKVLEGEKWAANKWVWNRAVGFGPGPH